MVVDISDRGYISMFSISFYKKRVEKGYKNEVIKCFYSALELGNGRVQLFKNSDSVPKYRDRKFFLQEMSTKRFEIGSCCSCSYTYLLNEPAR